jgi:hypothetical protein
MACWLGRGAESEPGAGSPSDSRRIGRRGQSLSSRSMPRGRSEELIVSTLTQLLRWGHRGVVADSPGRGVGL